MNNTKNRTAGLPLPKKIGYGSIEFSNSMIFTCFTIFGMFFLTDIVGINPAIAGMIVAAGAIWDAIAGPYFGITSDRSTNRYGRRRPFILASAIPFCIATWLIFTNWGFTGTGNIIYYVIMVIFLFTAIAALDVPYTALGAEMTQDYDQRTSLNTWRAVFAQAGGLFGAVIPISLAAFLGDMSNDINKGWSLSGLIMGLLAALVILFGWRMTRGGELFPEKTSVKLEDILKGPLSNKPFLYVIGFYSMGIMALALVSTLIVYYLQDYMLFDEEEISIAMAAFILPAFLWIPIIDFVSKKFSKRQSWLTFALLYLVANTCFYLLIRPDSGILLYVIFFFLSVMAMVPYQIGWSIIPDCVEVDEYKSGKRREGLYYGTINFLSKGGSALAIYIAGLLLEQVGYNTDLTVQTAETMDGVRVVLFSGPTLLTLIGIFFLILYPISKGKHVAILSAIEAKKRGEAVDESSFSDCIK